MSYFKREYLGRGHSDSWARALKDYARRREAIEPRLPENARCLDAWMKRHPFHDLVVKAVERIDADTIHIVLDDFYRLRLELLGVASTSLPQLDEPTIWLHDELDLTDAGLFVLRVLLNDGDLSITCRDVRLHSSKEHRYLIPEEPKPPGPTLFSGRPGRGSS